MNYIFILGLIVIVLVIFLIFNLHKSQKNEVYIIKRKGEFKIVKNKIFFTIPFIDKTKYIINLDKQVKSCYINPVISKDNQIIQTNSVITFHVTDLDKLMNNIKNFENELEKIQIDSFRNIGGALDSKQLQNIDDRIKFDFKNELNMNVGRLGLKIDEVDIKIWDNDNNAINSNQEKLSNTVKDKYPKEIDLGINTLNFNKNSISMRILEIVSLIILIFSLYVLFSGHKLTGIYFKILLHNIIVFIKCIMVAFAIIPFINMLFNKWLFNKIFVISFIFMCIYSLLYMPTDNTNLLFHEVAVIRDIIEDKTTISKYTFVVGSQVGSRSRHSYKSHLYRATISYGNDYSNYSEAGVKPSVALIVNELSLYKAIEIEYYNHSKAIKKINGIDIDDVDKFKSKLTKLHESTWIKFK